MLRIDVGRRLGSVELAATFAVDARVTALFGRSGAGKTSVVNMIAGLLRPDRGRIEIDGEVLFDSVCGVDVPVEKRRVGYVFQEGRLFPHLDVRRNLLYGHSLVPAAERYVAPEHVVELLGLGDLMERRPGDLSGGEKQRVAIGRALLASPRILLLDEPLASLDARRRDEVLRYLELLCEDLRVPMVYVSHSVEEVVRLAGAVVHMAGGRVTAAGSVEEVMGRPDLRAGGGVFEGGAVIDARVVAQDMDYDLATLAFDGGTLAVAGLDALVGEPVRVRVRARDVSVAIDEPRGISIRNILRGRVAAVGNTREGVVDVAIAVGSTMLRSRITRQAAEELGLAPGREVWALVKAVSLDRRHAG
ncbi:MAG: molybdenum ABC transporter ATP-binding protein [Burkholderiales bacterium]|nr:molybdenum ABC transporter ATP-binding protein [Burkholderiales bacterium]